MAVKYLFKVYDWETSRQLSQIITDCDHMIETIKILNELGMVKGFILNDKENDENDY